VVNCRLILDSLCGSAQEVIRVQGAGIRSAEGLGLEVGSEQGPLMWFR
jgi:hypothetical protein